MNTIKNSSKYHPEVMRNARAQRLWTELFIAHNLSHYDYNPVLNPEPPHQISFPMSDEDHAYLDRIEKETRELSSGLFDFARATHRHF